LLSLDVIAIPAYKASIYWAQTKEFVWPAFELFPGEVDSAEILKNLLSGKMLLWVAWEDEVIGGALTEVYNYAEFSAVRVLALGGNDFESWQETLDTLLSDFAKLWNCKRIEFYGRKGWERRLPNYTLDKIMLVRDV